MITPLIALILMAATTASPIAADLDALVFINGIGGFGDVGKMAASRDIVSPSNQAGFSMRVDWEDHPGDPAFWSIRLPFPAATEPQIFDTLSFDVYIESADDAATVSLFLAETDDDRWICWNHSLKDIVHKQWIHVETKRPDMTPWLTGNGLLEWDRLAQLGIEPSNGKAVFFLDAIRLSGPNGAAIDFITTEDDGLHTDPSWNEPIHLPREGSIYFPGLNRQNLIDAKSAQKFNALLGDVATSAYGAPQVRALEADGVGTFYYSAFGDGYQRFITRRQGWDVNARGESPNSTPFFERWCTGYHCLSYAHPAILEAGRHRVDALVKSGIGAWVFVDYCFPWSDGPFGYSPAMVDAFRKDLVGAGEGLHTLVDGEKNILRFPDYFRSYMGFYPEPSALGLKDWSEFTPPQPGEDDATGRARWSLFMYLRSYEWLKLPDTVGRYYQSKGGHGVWIIPNPEDSNGSSDYVHLLRSAGTRNLFPEWFGNIGLMSEAAYASLSYLREEADRSGAWLSVLFETGAGGHAAPYWDWRVTYNGAYALSALSRANALDNDFLDESTFEFMSDPANTIQFNRFRDGVIKALAFKQARAEAPKRPEASILCVSDRPPARATNSIFFGLSQPYSLETALSRAHLTFDLRDSFELERVLDRYRMVVYTPSSPRAGDMERLRAWLEAKPGRLLVTHTFIPTRAAREFWGMTRSAGLGKAEGGALFGLGAIAQIESKPGAITSATGVWSTRFPVGESIASAGINTFCASGSPVVSTSNNPLVTVARVGQSQVIYLHFSGEDPNSPAIASLNLRILQTVAGMIGEKPFCEADSDTSVQLFKVPGGYCVLVWDVPTLNKWVFRYEPGIAPLEYDAPGVNHVITLSPDNNPDGWIVYDFWKDTVDETQSNPGPAQLTLNDTTTTLFYVGHPTPEFRATLEAARRLRRLFRELKFE